MSMEFLKTYLQLTNHSLSLQIMNSSQGERAKYGMGIICFDFHLKII